MKKQANKNNQNEFLEIKKRKYKDAYLIYTRKSTDDSENQKNSISYQIKENTRFAHRETLSIASINIDGFCTDGVISEKHSGFKEDDILSFTDKGEVQYKIERPKFQKALQFLNEGYFKGMICLSWDRISRNKGDDALIRKLMRRGVDFRFVYAKYEKSSTGALHMDIDGMFSQHHSRVTSEKVTLATKNNRARGMCTYQAPIGYLNHGSMEHKPLDPKRAPIIRDLFKKYATGQWSLADLATYANEQGMTTVPRRRKRTQAELLDANLDIYDIPKTSRPITKNMVNRILLNPFYTGKILLSDGTYSKSSSHEALIEDTLFQKVQKQLKKKNVSNHYGLKIDLPLRGLIRCDSCSRVYTPYRKKEGVYFGSHCKNDCQNSLKNFSFKQVIETIGEHIKSLSFSEDEIAEMNAKTETQIALLEEERIAQLEQVHRHKAKIRDDLTFLRTNRIDLLKSQVYSFQEYQQEEEQLYQKLQKLTQSEHISDEAMHETMKDVQKISELVKNLADIYSFSESEEQEQFIRKIFSELSLSDKTFKYKLQTGLKCFEDRLGALGAQDTWFSEVFKHRFELKEVIKDFTALLEKTI